MKLRAGVIGLGILGSQHGRFLSERPETEVVAVADIRRVQAEAVADGVGAEPYDDYERMLQEQKLDVAVVAIPDPLHKAPVLAAIKAGVPTVRQERRASIKGRCMPSIRVGIDGDIPWGQCVTSFEHPAYQAIRT